MDFHAITPAGAELLMRVVDGEVMIVPPASQSWPEIASATMLDNPNLRGDECNIVRPAAESKES